MRILLTGSQGQLGWELRQRLAVFGEVLVPDRRSLDLSDPAQVARFVREQAPGIIINAAAYTDVERAESEAALARTVNALSPGAMADEARKLGALMVHFSSNYVFDGRTDQPYRESDPVSPLSVYGRTKEEGERRVRDSGTRHLILRTDGVFSGRGRNFLLTMLRLALEQDRLRVVADQIGSPSWSRPVAEACATLVATLADRPSVAETLHLSSQGAVSWYGFARAIVQWAALRGLCPLTPVDPIGSRDYPSRAVRPAYAVLDGERLRARYGIQLPRWETALQGCLDDLAETRAREQAPPAGPMRQAA